MESGKRGMTVAKARVICNRHGYNYTDEELQKMIDFMYNLAVIEWKVYERKRKEKLLRTNGESGQK